MNSFKVHGITILAMLPPWPDYVGDENGWYEVETLAWLGAEPCAFYGKIIKDGSD